MKFEALLELIKIIEYKDGGGVRAAMNNYWGFDMTQAIAKELGKAVDSLIMALQKAPYASLLVTTDHRIELDERGCAKSKDPKGGWKY